MQALNQTSYLLLAAVVVAITLVGVLGLTNWPARRAIVGGVVAVLLAAFLVLRSGGSQATSLNEVQVLSHGGLPVVVEVFSDF